MKKLELNQMAAIEGGVEASGLPWWCYVGMAAGLLLTGGLATAALRLTVCGAAS